MEEILEKKDRQIDFREEYKRNVAEQELLEEA